MSACASARCRSGVRVIGAIVRDGNAVFPRSDDVLLAGDRVIVFTESSRVSDVEKVL